MEFELNDNDIIDVCDITDRVDELRDERDNFTLPHPDGGERVAAPREWAGLNPDDAAELAQLEDILADLQGYGCDHQWKGSWYPATLIRDSYFEDYAQRVAVAAIGNASWPLTCIDWERAARELQMDYSSIEIDGITYWYR